MELTAVVSTSHTVLHLEILEGGDKVEVPNNRGEGQAWEQKSDLGNNIEILIDVRLDTYNVCVCVCASLNKTQFGMHP